MTVNARLTLFLFFPKTHDPGSDGSLERSQARELRLLSAHIYLIANAQETGVVYIVSAAFIDLAIAASMVYLLRLAKVEGMSQLVFLSLLSLLLRITFWQNRANDHKADSLLGEHWTLDCFTRGVLCNGGKP